VSGCAQVAPISFTQSDVDAVLSICQELLCPAAWGAGFPLSVTLGATCLSLSISDTNKELLLRSSFDNIGGQGSGGDHEHTFISHVLTGLGFEL
jgi:hypothetical protein